MDDDVVPISSDEEDREPINRRKIFAPAIHNVIAALGGFEGDEYKLGDEAYGCLKDLKKFWRKDDTDDERTVARIFWDARVLPNDLVPILLETAGKGLVEDRRAIACADLLTAMTWPIDLSEELKELDEELDKGTDYTQLLQSHLCYKAALLRPGVMEALLGIILPCLAKDKKERKERDGQIINVVLHLFRNLAFIKDRPANMQGSADQAEYASLQSKLIKAFSGAHILDLLMTIASNAKTDSFLNQWNTLVLEIFYLMFRGVSPTYLSMEESKRAKDTLSKLLEAENKVKVENARHASSRHSRFGTTISVLPKASKKNDENTGSTSSQITKDGDKTTVDNPYFILHRQRALNKETGDILDLKKRKYHRKANKVDDFGGQINLSSDAKAILQNTANLFIETCFNTFLSSLLKDIKSERPKIKEKDHLRLLFVAKWFLEFFLAVRARRDDTAGDRKAAPQWKFELVAEIVERGWIVWILKRMRQAVEEKPKLWTELQAGIECLTQLLLLIDCMAAVEISDPDLNEAAELLQQQVVYNGEVLDISVDSLRSYKEGVQSLQYLDSSIRLAYGLLRMLEKWANSRGKGEMYVRKKAKSRRNRKKNSAADDEGDEENIQMDAEDEDEHVVNEVLFTFETFEAKFAHEEITHTLITYLARYQEFTESDQMKRVVNLLHRQAVKAKAEGLFFKVSTLNFFKQILSRQQSLPKEQPYRDLVTLINFILRQFFKAVDKEPLLIVEAFFPKTRGRWKQFSSWTPESKEPKRREVEDSKFPPDVQVKKGHSWSEQLGIAIACLVETERQDLIDWTKEILMFTIGMRQRIVEEVDGSTSQSRLDDPDGEEQETVRNPRQPSNDAIAKFEDYLIPYISDEQAEAATKNPHLKLVFRLIKCYVLDDNADELEWYIPAAILPSDLQSSLNVVNQFLENPLDLNGKKATQMLSKKSRRRTRRKATSDDENDAQLTGSDVEETRKIKKAKKKKEKEQYKSAQFIEDSDAEYGDDEAFWARERAAREKTERAYAEGVMASMRSSGTKKRKRPTAGSKKRTLEERLALLDEGKFSDSNDSGDSDQEGVQDGLEPSTTTAETHSPEGDEAVSTVKNLKRSKPRPRPRVKKASPTTEVSNSREASPQVLENSAPPQSVKARSRIVLSDEDD